MVDTKTLTEESIEETGNRLLRLVEGEHLTSELVDIILQKAILVRASDIHMEPTKDGLRLRFRVDGLFQDVCFLPISIHDQVVARVKVLADLASHRRGLTQEGRIVTELGDDDDRATDLRVSVVPTVKGEKVVLRTFNATPGLFDVKKLGYDSEMTERLVNMLHGLQGMVVLTGPSGSGKTTTLYACLLEIFHKLDECASIITIEDPVEYEFGLWAQMQVNRQLGLDFAQCLTSVLRQDPEVIMVGEIRDVETCNVAMRAGLTGHLVLTTIHSGSAPEVITRVLNMGIEPFIVASALSGIIAQRLARVICSECKTSYEPHSPMRQFAERVLERTDIEFYQGTGCSACGNLGHQGRVPVAELVELDDALRTLILDEPSTTQLRKFLRERDVKTILDDGLEKVVQGKTTIEEVFRFVSHEDRLS